MSGDDLYPIDRERYGWSVASNGDVNGDGYEDVVVGAPGQCCGGIPGRVSVYFGSSTAGGPEPVAGWTFQADTNDTELGAAVALADVDADGFSDVIACEPELDLGRVVVFPGSSAGPSAEPVWILDPITFDDLCESLATGDVNGDGFADIAVGAGVAGYVFLFLGSATGPGPFDEWIGFGDDTYGVDLALGDLNGDGFDDLIISDSGNERVEVRRGSATGLGGIGSEPDRVLEGPVGGPDVAFGSSVAAGDVNNDGFADVIVGGVDNTFPQDGGALFVFLGAPAGVDTAPAWTHVVQEETEWTNFGERVEWAGDLDRDGFGDIASGESEFGSTKGRVQVFRGSSDGPSVATWVELGRHSDGLGYALGTGGDLNADGFDDLVVTALNAEPDGAAHLFLGGILFDPDGDGVTASTDVCLTVPNPDQTDSNGDGLGDDCEPLVLVPNEVSVSAGLEVDVSDALPNEVVRVFLANGPPVDEPCPKKNAGLCLGVGDDGRVSWNVQTDQDGQGSLAVPLPAGLSAGQVVTIQAAAERGTGGVTSVAFEAVVEP